MKDMSLSVLMFGAGVVAALLTGFVVNLAAEEIAGPNIRQITVVGTTRTDSSVVLRELLFRVGEPLDTTLVQESERNLRRLLFLGRVETRLKRDSEFVDVEVRLQDLYARVLTPQLSGEVDELSYGLIALDYNLRGRGQMARVDLNHNAVSGNSAALYYRHPRLGDSRHALAANIRAAEEGHDLALSVSHPFYALLVPWSYGVSMTSSEHIARLYSRQDLVAKYEDRREAVSAWVTRSYGSQRKFRAGVRLSMSDHRFTSKANFAYVPEDRRRVLPSIGLTVWKPRYEKTRFLFTLGRVEDVQLGNWLDMRLGASAKHLGSDRNFGFAQVQLSPTYKPRPDLYFFGTAFHSLRFAGGGTFNRYSAIILRVYLRPLRHQTIAMRFWWDALGESEDQSQLLLGVDRGLRGYAPRRLDGSRRLLFNLEARPTFLQNRTFVLAGALFADAGATWSSGENQRDLITSAGLGGRVGLLNVYNSPILRADWAYGFSDSSWQLSFGLGQHF